MLILNSFNSSHVLLHSGDLFELGCIVGSPHNSVVAKRRACLLSWKVGLNLLDCCLDKQFLNICN